MDHIKDLYIEILMVHAMEYFEDVTTHRELDYLFVGVWLGWKYEIIYWSLQLMIKLAHINDLNMATLIVLLMV